MKKCFLLLSTFAVVLFLTDCKQQSGKATTAVEVQNEDATFVEIPDANFKAFLLENFDKNKDGNISLAEAKAVTTIDCSGKNIALLDGIEQFTNLESLNCSDNQLDELELRYNKKLNKLICTNNIYGLMIYVGMTSPLVRKDFTLPSNDSPEGAAMVNPLDMTKCIAEVGQFNAVLCFSD